MTDGPPEQDAGSYYVLATVNRIYFYLTIREGDELGTAIDALRDGFDSPDRAGADPMFVTFTDAAGSEVRVNAMQIEAFYTSTPENRQRDREHRRAQAAEDKARKEYGDDED